MNRDIFKLCKISNIDINKIFFVDGILYIESNDKIYFLKKKNNISEDKLTEFGFDFPMLISENDMYCMYLYGSKDEYYKEKDLKRLISNLIKLHSCSMQKITFSKSQYNDFYNSILLKIEDVEKYYLKLHDDIENYFYPKIYYYFLIINISLFYNIINMAKYYLDKWYDKEEYNFYKAFIINKAWLSNFCCGEKNYFIDTDSLVYDFAIYDIVNFYKRELFNDNVFEYIDYYFNNIDIDIDLFFALICIPNKIDFSDRNFDNILLIRNEINYINRTFNYISEKYEEDKKTDN